ncbi:Wzz/FepE/Etk N-terminal domain-containing protein [Calidifontibacillus oryziterrae]|uniref:Wzz/FepE/Etk N-terminal domain-containing protein n=1 Tax=Calidifontibacillus oryziterrae TaxID=1191699 RepID=UPI00030D0DD6|nr:Wzz/FepE/Etk N-terminal domain-containing protein [Calidifontibacillus oryziterrae]
MEEEISLREIIETLLEGKWIIAAITAIAILISGIVSFFVISPTYEAEATIMINAIQESEPSFLDSYVNEMVSPNIYAERLKSPVLIDRVIESEGLEESGWTSAALRNALNIEVEKETDLVSIKLKGENPKEIATIINSIIKHSTAYTAERIGGKIGSLLEEYEVQMKNEQKKLDEAIEEYNQLKAGSGLPSIVLFKEAIGGGQFVIETNKEILDELQNLDKTKQIELNQINSKIEKLTKLYNGYSEKYEEARSISSFALAKNKITPLVEAVAPETPVAPKKVLNVAIATVVGLMLGVFVAFFRAYWRNTGTGSMSQLNREQGGNGLSV